MQQQKDFSYRHTKIHKICNEIKEENFIKDNRLLRQEISLKNTTISNLRHQLKSHRTKYIKHAKWKDKNFQIVKDINTR